MQSSSWVWSIRAMGAANWLQGFLTASSSAPQTHPQPTPLPTPTPPHPHLQATGLPAQQGREKHGPQDRQ